MLSQLEGPVSSRPTQDRGLPLPDRVSREFLLYHRLCPLRLDAQGSLLVAVTEGTLQEGLDDLSIAYARPVLQEPVGPETLDLLIARLTATEVEEVELAPGPQELSPGTSDIRDIASQPPVIRYVNLLIREAYDAGASDIHLEATRGGLEARFRIDGVLTPGPPPPMLLDRAVVSRVKLLADLDIAECRRPQDGRIRVRLHDRELDLRLSTVPTIFGESVVLRMLERGGGVVSLSGLGMSATLLGTVEALARRPHGMILVTGPTGSGKTTTLYAALSLRHSASEKIITLEDPVEYALEGAVQVPVHVQTGVTFASMLRSILRQDPDVMLIGEMRDMETAELAVQAALTGHVVFSTLHTNDAVGAVPRLIDLGVAPYLVTSTLDAVLAQRLVRRTCEECREAYVPDAAAVALLARDLPEATRGPMTFTRGRGCPACRGTGHRGRTGIFELLLLSERIRGLIVREPSSRLIREAAREEGMVTLRADGWLKALAGLTTVEEVLRVTDH